MRFALILSSVANLLFATAVRAEMIRVTSWNLEDVGTNGAVALESAEVLKGIAPDVILLQGVRDWKMCSQFAEKLKPANYYVLICSSFPANGSSSNQLQQVAVLCRYKAYFFWSEPWSAESAQQSSGFAFAAVQIGGRRLGFFTANLAESASSAEIKQMLEHAGTVARWEANQVQSFIIGLASQNASAKGVQNNSAGSLLQQAGYSDPFIGLAQPAAPGEADLQSDRILIQPTVFPTRPVISRSLNSRHPFLSCELEMDPAAVARSWTARAQELERLAATTSQKQDKIASPDSDQKAIPAATTATIANWALPDWRMVVGVILILLGLVGAWLLVRPRKTFGSTEPTLLPARLGAGITSSYTVVVSSPEQQDSSKKDDDSAPIAHLDFGATHVSSAAWQQRALAAENEAARANFVLQKKLRGSLAQWLKQTFVRKLLKDREELLSTQQDAAFKALRVDERLAKIEQQIQQQTHKYELRIEELTRELLAAREENRELIRARIAQVKLEMEAVRSRMMAQAREELD